VKKADEPHFGTFDRVPLENLPATEARQLIRQCTAAAQVDVTDEEYPLLERHVLNQSQGNPQAIVDRVERLSKEGRITPDTLAKMKDRGPQRPFNRKLALILLLLILTAARYCARFFGAVEAYVLGGFLYAVLIGCWVWFYRSRR